MLIALSYAAGGNVVTVVGGAELNVTSYFTPLVVTAALDLPGSGHGIPAADAADHGADPGAAAGAASKGLHAGVAMVRALAFPSQPQACPPEASSPYQNFFIDY